MSERDAVLTEALVKVSAVLDDNDIDFVLIGSVAITYHLIGEPSIGGDVDFFIREADVDRAIAALDEAGFQTARAHPTWLFKVYYEGGVVDVLHVAGFLVMFDDDILRHSVEVDIDGARLRLASPEDLAIIQTMATREETPQYWYHAQALLRSSVKDWDYLVRRGAVGPDRLLAMLSYARSDGIAVPERAFAAASDIT